MNPFTLIEWQRHGDAVVVQLRYPRLDEHQINALTAEILQLGSQTECHRLVLRFGPKPVECMYSVFLAKLITLQRQLAEKHVALILCEMGPAVFNIFRACRLDHHFLFAASPEQALDLTLPEPLPGRISPPCHNPRCDGPHPSEGME